jgi:hypothetical protein
MMTSAIINLAVEGQYKEPLIPVPARQEKAAEGRA